MPEKSSFLLKMFSKREPEEKKKLKEIQKILRYNFSKNTHLIEALTHTSYVNENPELGIKSNETLEFLGDSVLGLIITEYLYERFPDFSEGKLSILKSTLVSEPILAELSLGMNLGEYLILGKGEDKSATRLRPSVLSNALEALIGGIYMDGDLKSAKKFIYRIYAEKFRNMPEADVLGSFKNRLQHFTQKEFNCIPVYRVVSEKGPSHNKIYEVAVNFRDKTYGIGKGTSKKRAEQEAAKNTLVILGLEK
jgi:ribonuclease-3